MIRKRLSILFLIQLIFFIYSADLCGMVTIKPDHPNFQYTGRIDYSVPDKPVLYWPGTYIKAKFEGSLLIILLDDKSGQSYYNVFIDENYANPHLIDCRTGNNIYLVSASLADTVHSLLIFRRTEASTGPTKFLGIQINDGKTLLAPPARPEHKILFYGNSITCGLGNEAPDNIDFGAEVYNNNFQAYGAIASRLLNADYMCIAKSGIGIMISWFDMVMSQYYYRLDPDNPQSYWDFDQYVPDVVVINLFQNDSWLIGNLSPVPDSTQITAAYINFVREIRTHHPDAFIICSLGSMDATRAGSPWPGYIEKAVAYLQNQDNDFNIDTYFFPFDPSWSKHPRVRHHQAMGQNLADYIKEKMGWSSKVEPQNNITTSSNFYLLQNYPNPFNPSTIITYQLPSSGHVSIKVRNALGQEVATLVNEEKPAGCYQVEFNTTNLSSGIYFYEMRSGEFRESKKLTLMK
jgi:hypothetical protein